MDLDALLDRSVVFSFDRTGYERHARHYGDVVERSLDGTEALVTGGSAGIGLSAARGLAARGAHVHLWARDRARGRAAVQRIRDEGGQATFRSVDLGDLAAVAEAAADLQPQRLSGVVCNAGAMPRVRKLTPQGHEHTWASHVLGHLVLLRTLRRADHLRRGTRVVWVSSGAMYLARLDLTDLRRDAGFRRHRVYAQTKRAQVILGSHLAERWPDVPVAVMHPGWVETAGVRQAWPLFHAATRPLLRSHDQGADTVSWLLARREPLRSGRFWFDREVQPVYAFGWTRERTDERAALIRRVLADTERYLPPRPLAPMGTRG